MHEKFPEKGVREEIRQNPEQNVLAKDSYYILCLNLDKNTIYSIIITLDNMRNMRCQGGNAYENYQEKRRGSCF